MTRQNVSRMEALEGGVQSRPRIRQCHAEDCQVHALVRRQLRRCSSGVDVDALAVHLNQKRKRFSADPVGGALRRPAFANLGGSLVEGADQMALCRKPIVCRRTTREFSMDRFAARRRVLLRRRLKRRRPAVSGKVDTGCRRNETRPCLRHHSRNIQQVIEMSVRHQNRVRPALLDAR